MVLSATHLYFSQGKIVWCAGSHLGKSSGARNYNVTPATPEPQNRATCSNNLVFSSISVMLGILAK